MDIFPKIYKLLKLNLEEIEHMNKLITSKEIQYVIKYISRKKTPGSDDFLGEHYICFKNTGVPVVAKEQELVSAMNPTSIHEGAVQSMAPLSGLRIPCCHKLWCRSQTWHGFGVAVAVARLAAAAPTPSLGTSICHRCTPKKEK